MSNASLFANVAATMIARAHSDAIAIDAACDEFRNWEALESARKLEKSLKRARLNKSMA